jgi:hypothetical protein
VLLRDMHNGEAAVRDIHNDLDFIEKNIDEAPRTSTRHHVTRQHA